MLVEGQACDRVQEGTGFVAGENLIVTNAHVVAGENRTHVVTSDGRRLDTTVVAFDPNRDLAVLRAPGLGLPALTEGDGQVDDRGALFGHPGGGPLRQAPVRIAEQIVARGTDIYPQRADRARASSCWPRSPRPATPALRWSTPRAG